MKIEALETIKSSGYVLDAEDVKTVPDEIGTRWCKLGWAKDTSGKVPTGQRNTSGSRLSVSNAVINPKSSGVGVK